VVVEEGVDRVLDIRYGLVVALVDSRFSDADTFALLQSVSTNYNSSSGHDEDLRFASCP
jgi:hypothetical protein